MFKRLLTFLAVLLVAAGAFAALLATEWLPPTRPEHRAALEFLSQPRTVPEGRSAFAVLWFMPYDIEGLDPDHLLRQDLDAFARLVPDATGFSSLAADLPTIPLLQEGLCAGFPQPCLPEVRALPDRGAGQRATYAAQLRSSDALLHADHYAYPFPKGRSLQIPRQGRVINLRRFGNAQAFVTGDSRQALASTCRELAVWRRLRPTANILIHDMVAIAFAQTQAGLVAEMLGEWPAGQPLPDACDVALAPLSGPELDQCNVWRGEAEYIAAQSEAQRGVPGNAEQPLPGWLHEILINRRRMIEFDASWLAAGCNGYRPAPPGELDWKDWVFDPIGSVKWKARDNDHIDYHDRHLDHLDVLRALRIQAWLRTQSDREAAWTNLPADLGPVPAGLSFEANADRLVMSFRFGGTQRDGPWFLPLPSVLPAHPSPG